MPKNFSTADAAFADACREWLKSCSCAPPTKPHKCKKCTKAFLKAVRKRAKMFNAATGTNSLSAIDARVRAQRVASLRARPLGNLRIIWHDALHATIMPRTAEAWFAEQRAKGIKAVVEIADVNQNSRVLNMSRSVFKDDPQVGDDILLVNNALGGIYGPLERVTLISKSEQRDRTILWGYCPAVAPTDTSR